MSKITLWFSKEQLNKMIENFKKVSSCSGVNELIGLTPEEIINHKEAPRWAFWYVKDVLKTRDESFEEVIKKSPEYSYYYVKYFLKIREKSFEKSIKKSPEWSYDYVRDFLKIREKSFEKSIKQNEIYWKKYQGCVPPA